MPPADNTNVPTPTPEPTQPPVPQQQPAQPEKKGFWDKLKHLFDKKVAPQEPHYSTENDTPVPADQIGTDTPVQESAPADQPTDPQTGAPQATDSSGPDPDGETTTPEVAVPEDVKANPGEETPTVPGAPSSGEQFTQPTAPEQPQVTPPAPQAQQPYQQPPVQQPQPPQPPAQNQQ